ncbi:hypothetical protein [Bdellovibrio reynosensis]|uniref:Uncharacterized protein n=1 Tax=Bdellovibrio reynosensis TaxID=2835041 RepID=A0ABY4CCJ9_9BACT|nr:hypothetical protein [Bdellovibrio reynosensis]UOF01396.1 hypothetical protein MNR06_00320 [Bdellovibrio reynosensis]
MKNQASLFLLFILFIPTVSFGLDRKADILKSLVNRQCQKSISEKQALQFVKMIYLTCIPDSNVSVLKDCSLPCRKATVETVVGP